MNILVRNRPEMFSCLLQRFQFIEIQRSKSPNLICINDILVKISANISKAVDGKFWLNKRQPTIGLDDLASRAVNFYPNYVARLPACWVPFDIFMENTMDGKHLYATSAIDILTGEVPFSW